MNAAVLTKDACHINPRLAFHHTCRATRSLPVSPNAQRRPCTAPIKAAAGGAAAASRTDSNGCTDIAYGHGYAHASAHADGMSSSRIVSYPCLPTRRQRPHYHAGSTKILHDMIMSSERNRSAPVRPRRAREAALARSLTPGRQPCGRCTWRTCGCGGSRAWARSWAWRQAPSRSRRGRR